MSAISVFKLEDISIEWLNSMFAESSDQVVGFRCNSVGTGQMGANIRVELEWKSESVPSTVIMKFASNDKKTRATGIQTGAYEKEIRFYSEVSHLVDVALPKIYRAEIIPGTADMVLVMEDLAPMEQGDQLVGSTFEQAQVAVREAARLHGSTWDSDSLSSKDWLTKRKSSDIGDFVALVHQLFSSFFSRYKGDVSKSAIDVGNNFLPLIHKWLRTAPDPICLTHGDFRLDNLMFDMEAERALVVVDWQTVSFGLGISDISYFLGSGLRPALRSQYEKILVQEYYDVLKSYLEPRIYTFSECWYGYRRQSFGGYLMAIVAAMLVERTQRGDQMFLAMLERHADQVVQLDAFSLLS
ncbi:MAG: phosphotransferase [Actinomycetota bacterium]|nr:phosphotransferase [Actinomycetota bacterium]MDG2121010.1 phosphotransferase [Actinomycetota bacterium]